MLKIQIINNTWACDACGLETNTEVNPYFQLVIQNNGSIVSTSGEIDLCETCIDTIEIQPIVDYIANIDLIPKG